MKTSRQILALVQERLDRRCFFNTYSRNDDFFVELVGTVDGGAPSGHWAFVLEVEADELSFAIRNDSFRVIEERDVVALCDMVESLYPNGFFFVDVAWSLERARNASLNLRATAAKMVAMLADDDGVAVIATEAIELLEELSARIAHRQNLPVTVETTVERLPCSNGMLDAAPVAGLVDALLAYGELAEDPRDFDDHDPHPLSDVPPTGVSAARADQLAEEVDAWEARQPVEITKYVDGIYTGESADGYHVTLELQNETKQLVRHYQISITRTGSGFGELLDGIVDDTARHGLTLADAKERANELLNLVRERAARSTAEAEERAATHEEEFESDDDATVAETSSQTHTTTVTPAALEALQKLNDERAEKPRSACCRAAVIYTVGGAHFCDECGTSILRDGRAIGTATLDEKIALRHEAADALDDIREKIEELLDDAEAALDSNALDPALDYAQRYWVHAIRSSLNGERADEFSMKSQIATLRDDDDFRAVNS